MPSGLPAEVLKYSMRKKLARAVGSCGCPSLCVETWRSDIIKRCQKRKKEEEEEEHPS